MKKLGKLLALLLATMLAFSCVAFAEEVSYPEIGVKPEGGLRIAYMCRNLDVETQNRQYHQAQMECAHRGWEFVDGFYQNFDEGRTKMQAFINQGVDAFVFGNTDMTSFADLVVRARQAGIGVYNIDNQLVEGVISNATQPNGVVAASMAYQIGQDLGWNADYAIITNRAVQVHTERTDVAKAVYEQYSAMNLVAEESTDSYQGTNASIPYDITKRLLEKYGDELDLIYCSSDILGCNAAAAAEAHIGGSNVKICSVDGTSQSLSCIRAGSNLCYVFAQPVELYNHETFELIQQLQVEGLQPGDAGCKLPYYGATLYYEGYVITPENVPDAGQPVYAIFDYYRNYGYDPENPECWVNWDDCGGPSMIQE